MLQEYYMPAAYGQAELAEKKSRFIARVWPVENEAEALEHIAATRAAHRDASHNVYAFIIRTGQCRCSDDGEPQGSSGLPTLGALRNEELVNVCCVVTRYYGGIQLGTGGLARAYAAATKSAMQVAGKCLMRQWDIVLVASPYAFFERLKVLVAAHGGNVETAEFGADVLLQALLPTPHTQDFITATLNMSSGIVRPEPIDTVFRGVRIF